MTASAAYAQSFDLVINNGRVMDPETGFDQVANVGIAEDGGGLLQAMISFDAQTVVELSTLVGDMSGWERLTTAFDVNESGQIVGTGITASGLTQAFLLTPIPGPGAVWLLGSALGLLGWTGIRRRRA